MVNVVHACVVKTFRLNKGGQTNPSFSNCLQTAFPKDRYLTDDRKKYICLGYVIDRLGDDFLFENATIVRYILANGVSVSLL